MSLLVVGASLAFAPSPLLGSRVRPATPLAAARSGSVSIVGSLEGFGELPPGSGFDELTTSSTAGAADFAVAFMIVAIALGFLLTPEEESGVEDPTKARTTFGWLHADMRVPLPPLAELRQSCHPIGEYEGRLMYLCGSDQPIDGNLTECEQSNDFSKFYGTPVYLCKGGSVASLDERSV